MSISTGALQTTYQRRKRNRQTELQITDLPNNWIETDQ